jgi:Cytochrome P460
MNMNIPHILLICATLALAGCGSHQTPSSQLINQDASVAADLSPNPLNWRVISSSIDKRSATMSTLYGNDRAVDYARANTDQHYPPGSVLSKVTWIQQEDDYWFGAKIPQKVKSVEFVRVESAPDHALLYRYQLYQGAPLKNVRTEENRTPSDAAKDLLSERASVMP